MSTHEDVRRALTELTDSALAFRANIDERVDQLETRINRAAFPNTFGGGSNEPSLARTAFQNFIRHGREGLEPHEIKALVVSDDTQGGFLADADFVAELLKNIVQYSPVRQAARVGRTSSGEVKVPRRTGTLTASWVGEIESRSSTEPSYGQIGIPINEAACFVDLSNQLIEDSAVDLAAELASDIAEEFGRLEGVAFVNGDSVKKPQGFLQDANVAYTPSGSASAVLADSLISVLYALKPYYRARSTWMMNGTTLAIIRKAKDGNGQWLWQPGLIAGQPETILGRPVVEAVDFPDVAGNAFPIAVGDFQSGYRIYDRLALAVLRDPYSIATTGQTRFHARRRVGGGVVKAEAIRKLKIATS